MVITEMSKELNFMKVDKIEMEKKISDLNNNIDSLTIENDLIVKR